MVGSKKAPFRFPPAAIFAPSETLSASCFSSSSARSSRAIAPKLTDSSNLSPVFNVFNCSLNKSRNCVRSEEHTSELQSRPHLVCRLLLEKKKKKIIKNSTKIIYQTLK